MALSDLIDDDSCQLEKPRGDLFDGLDPGAPEWAPRGYTFGASRGFANAIQSYSWPARGRQTVAEPNTGVHHNTKPWNLIFHETRELRCCCCYHLPYMASEMDGYKYFQFRRPHSCVVISILSRRQQDEGNWICVSARWASSTDDAWRSKKRRRRKTSQSKTLNQYLIHHFPRDYN